MTRRLPPMKEEALRLLARGSLRNTPGVGWQSEFSQLVFNTHTVSWLVSERWAEFINDSSVAQITPAGRHAHTAMEAMS